MNMTSLKSLYNMELQNCRLCHNPARHYCENCGDSYCTTLCQITDWERHRYICMPMPNLIERPYVAQQNIETKIKPESNQTTIIYPAQNSEVILKAISGIDIAFIYDAKTYNEHKQVLEKVHKYGLSAARLQNVPSINSFAIALNMGKYMRLKIMKVEGSSCHVKFIDTYFNSHRSLNELHEISEECINLPNYTLPVHLESVPRGMTSVASRLGFDKFYNKRYRINYVQTKENTKYPSAELINIKTEESLNKQIIQLLNMGKSNKENGNSNENDEIPTQKNGSVASDDLDDTINGNIETACETEDIKSKNNHESKDEIIETPISKSSSVTSLNSKKSFKQAMAKEMKTVHKPVLEPPFKFSNIKDLPKNIDLFIVDTTDLKNGIFGCIEQQHLANLQLIKNYTDNIFKPGSTPYSPVKNEYCMALYENEWYRARCHNVENDKFSVYYIDFTNEQVLDKESLRPYDINLTTDCHTMSCAIQDLPDLNEKQLDFAKKWGLQDYQTISAYVIEQGASDGPGFIWVQIKDLIDKMRAANLLEK